MAENTPSNDDKTGVFTVLTQYLKDLSFESPNAPASLRPSDQTPEVEIGINVNATAIGDDNYDVVLSINAKAGDGKDMLFNVELLYGGVFRLQNIPEEHMTPVLLIECPKFLFPFARQILSDATRNGGFPPLLVDPVDFDKLFQQRRAEEEQQAKAKPKPN